MKKPRCPKCNKIMKNGFDRISNKVSPYLWECPCSPNVKLSMG